MSGEGHGQEPFWSIGTSRLTKKEGSLRALCVSAVSKGSCLLILALSALAVYALLPRFLCQIHLLQAKTCERREHYGLAVTYLQKAHEQDPRDPEPLKQMGKVYLKLGEKGASAEQAFFQALKAKEAFVSAEALHGFDVDIAFGLAVSEARLEQAHAFLHPEDKSSPYDALPHFRRVMELRPNGTIYHYSLAQYLYREGRHEEFLAAVRALVRSDPPACHDLKRESFWGPEVREAVKEGLTRAIAEGIQPLQAHRAMASLSAEEERWAEAIAHFQKTMDTRASHDGSKDYVELGRLFLHGGQPDEAEAAFFKVLNTSYSPGKDLEVFYGCYKSAAQLDALYAFYEKVKTKYDVSPEIEILMARCLMELQRYNQAERVLTELNETEPNAEAYYWLARIAEKDQDWDRAELAIQKATVLEPSNRQYRQYFTGVLRRLGKTEAVEKELGRNIERSDAQSAAFFNERAQIRWKRGDYQGAAEDWKSAIALSPRNAAYYASTGEAYIRMGKWDEALAYYQKATRLDPKNKDYSKKYLELKAGTSS